MRVTLRTWRTAIHVGPLVCSLALSGATAADAAERAPGSMSFVEREGAAAGGGGGAGVDEFRRTGGGDDGRLDQFVRQSAPFGCAAVALEQSSEQSAGREGIAATGRGR